FYESAGTVTEYQSDRHSLYVCAIRDFEQPSFSVRCGDIILDPKNVTDQYGSAKNPLTHEFGFVCNDVATDAVVKSLMVDAWQCVGRDKAANLLSRSEVEPGMFILRPTADGESIGLTVRTDAQAIMAHWQNRANFQQAVLLKCVFLIRVADLSYLTLHMYWMQEPSLSVPLI
ncbi:hypothetical protein TSMEX_006687, partial [Taenia solium]